MQTSPFLEKTCDRVSNIFRGPMWVSTSKSFEPEKIDI